MPRTQQHRATLLSCFRSTRTTAACAIAAFAMAACASSSSTSSTSFGAAGTASTSAALTDRTELGTVDTRAGTGTRATPHSCLYVHYIGLLADGKQFETSRTPLKNGSASPPIAFEISTGTVMPGWEKGLIGMQVGGMRRLFIPFRLAYGAAGRPPAIPPRTDLVFDVELLAVSSPLPNASNAPRADGTTTCSTWAAVNRGR